MRFGSPLPNENQAQPIASGKVTPRYYEEDVEAYVTPMREVNGELLEVEGAKPSITINPNKPR